MTLEVFPIFNDSVDLWFCPTTELKALLETGIILCEEGQREQGGCGDSML